MHEKRVESWRRMCLSKKWFSEEVANKIAKRFGQRAYECPHCHGWHCTSQPEPKRVTVGRATDAFVREQQEKAEHKKTANRLKCFPWKSVTLEALRTIEAIANKNKKPEHNAS